MANKEDKDTLQVPESIQNVPAHEPTADIQPHPGLSTPSELPSHPAPPISPSSEANVQPSQEVSLSAPPAAPDVTFSPNPTAVAANQPVPELGVPTDVWQPQPVQVSPSSPPADPVDVGFVPTVPSALPQPPEFSPSKNSTLPAPPAFVPAENLRLPDPPSFSPVAPAELPPPPVVVLSAPAELPDPPGFQAKETTPAVVQDVDIVQSVPSVLPDPPQFSPQANSTLPDMPVPPLSAPSVLPPMPAPPPSAPSVLPGPPSFDPAENAVLPGPPSFDPAANAVLPAPPVFDPNPNGVLPPPPDFSPETNAVLPQPPGFSPQPNSTLPDPPEFSPQPNSILPQPPEFVAPPMYAPNGEVPGANDVLGRLDLIDEGVKKVLHSILPFSETGGGPPGSHVDDPVLYAKNLKRLGVQVGGLNLGQFSALQYTLFSMNVNGKIWNPNTLAPPPGAVNWIPAAIDDFVTHENFVDAGLDAHLRDRVTDTVGHQQEQNIANNYSADNPYDQSNAGTFFSIGGMVDALTGKGNDQQSLRILQDSDLKSGVTDASQPVTLPIQKTNIAALYSTNLVSVTKGGPRINPSLTSKVATNLPLPGSGDKLARAYYSSGIVPAGFENETNGFITTVIRRDDPSTQIDDDSAYVPLSFMDMRPMNGSNQVRTVYFRPFISSLTEELTPEWSKANFFGRTDVVATYMATGRTINIGFTVQAFAPEDLELIYQKKNWLASMCYPSYDKDMLYKSGPIVRLRVGDLLKTGGGFGLPGIIESLSFDYNDVVWELQKGNKVPMGFKVSLSFLVLHEKPIGLGVDGQFGGVGVIDPGTGKWSPPQNTTNSQAQNAPEMDGHAVDSFAGGTGNKLNSYSTK